MKKTILGVICLILGAGILYTFLSDAYKLPTWALIFTAIVVVALLLGIYFVWNLRDRD